MIIGAATVLVYTMLGGMFSVAITDFIQMIIIVLGMLYIGWEVSGIAGGVGAVIAHAAASGKFHILPGAGAEGHPLVPGGVDHDDAGLDPAAGRVPARAVGQEREHRRRAPRSWAACLYFCFAFIPMFLAYSATPHRPEDGRRPTSTSDPQLILPNLILSPIVPIFAQIMFFGALLSAIKSCASATLLAPSVTFSENILRPFFPHIATSSSCTLMRIVIVCFTVHGHRLRAELRREHLQDGRERLQGDAGGRLRAAGVRPVLEARDQPRAPRSPSSSASSSGSASRYYEPDGLMPPQLAGLVASFAGMIVGSLAVQGICRPREATT